MELADRVQQGEYKVIVFTGQKLVDVQNNAYERINEAKRNGAERWTPTILSLDYAGYEEIKSDIVNALSLVKEGYAICFISASLFVYREVEIRAKELNIKVLWTDMDGNMGEIDDPDGVVIPHVDYELEQSSEYLELSWEEYENDEEDYG